MRVLGPAISGLSRIALVALSAALFFAANAVRAADPPLIDAHSQIDCHVDDKLILDKIGQLGLRHVLISARGCKSEPGSVVEKRLFGYAKRLSRTDIDPAGHENRRRRATGRRIKGDHQPAAARPAIRLPGDG